MLNFISIFKQVYVAEQTGLSLTQSETSKTGFLAMRPISVPYDSCVLANGADTVEMLHSATFR